MGDAYSYYSIMNEGQPSQYFRLYNNGKVIETQRTIYLEGFDMPVVINDITEIRVGKSSLRFITLDGRYYIVSRDKMIFSTIDPTEETGVIL